MKDVLVLEGSTNVTPYILAHGYIRTRNALHSSKTTRTKDGRARVDKIADKRTLSFELGNVPEDVLAEIDAILMKQTFRASYRDLTGMLEREFYCSSFAPKAEILTDGQELWSGASFTIVEV